MTAQRGDQFTELAELVARHQRPFWRSYHEAARREAVAEFDRLIRPVVERLIAQGAAEQLELVALLTVSGEDTPQDIREALFRRAASLREGESR